ncbi:lysozyme [Lactobacillus johnsonii]|nr:GH25 family lysozyme [Lactobacillus johnsonii]ARW75669.1 lysozyme [Lactobacillus johnsonii]ARW76371.1 lysozyme [Lactobacillus johnsonii]
MRSTNKKFISALACASAMTALAIVDPMGVTKTHQVAQAATDNVPARSAGVDVSSWQSTNLNQQAKSGAQFAVVKVSEGTNYQNPNAQGQIQSAEQNNMMTMGYHYTHFGSDSNRAVQEGNYAVNSAQQAGLPQGSYLATDWEQDVNNNTNGSVAANTNAITSFMDTVHDGGYNPMLYSNEWLLKNKVDTNKISEKYPNALWVAKYKTNGREDNPDFNYFPSMDNVAIWQYTQNWRGQNVDGNVNVVPLSNKTNTNNNTSNNAANTNNSNANNGQSSSQAPARPNTNKPAQPTNKPSQPSQKPSTNTNVNSDWTKQNGVFVTGGAINLRTGASTNSKVIAELPANSEVKYDAYRTIGQYTWLRQPRANNEYGYLVGRNNGQAWGTFKEGSATASKPAETKPANKPAKPTNKPSTNTNVNSDWTKQNGVFVTGGAINLRTGASTNSKVIAELPANSEVKYDAYRTIGQYTWLRQPRANNEYGYLVGRNNGQAWGTFKEGSATASKPAETKPANKPAKPTNKPSTNTNVNSDWTKQNGVFVTGGAINLRTGASTNSKVIAELPANSEVKYDAYRTIGQYTWLRQPRANNEYGYLVGRNNGQAWGTFKEGSATASKPAETKPANKPAKPTNKPSTNTNVNSDWTKQNGVFVTGGAINLRTGASTNSKVIAMLPTNTEIKYDAYRTEGQYTWLRQPRANGQYGYLVGRDNGQAWGTFKEGSATASKPAETKPANKPAKPTNKPSTNTNVNSDWTKQNGVFVTGGAINLRTGASTNSKVIAMLPTNTEIKYDAYRTEGQYTWLRQPRANGQYGYLVGRDNGQAWGTFKEGSAKATNAVANKPVQQTTPKQVNTNNNASWTKQNGTFITGGAINLRTGASTTSPIIETLPINTVIKYDAYYRSGNYVWLRQPRANGQYGYLVGRLNNQAWGTYR